ncbi:MAG: tetratricopeptide repeat protein [Pyrinomonadaceae bacterium]|jgi:tetratricopeptide (TPR) repeat protein|nr:tetratricopeptide repeat protein [Pyrinomonadaceae bacterium]
MTKRFTVVLAIVLYSLAAWPASHPAHAKDTWVSVRSSNFFLVGNAGEKEVRKVATRLEQFREVFSRLFPRMKFTSPIPTTVVVFKSDSSYKPFKPVADGKTVAVAGYFQPGREVNYITLTTEKREENPYAVIFHEYVHLLINNTLGRSSIPSWFNEGLAEYYSTFDIEDDQKIHLGNLINSHLQLLRTNQLVPLDKLFGVDYYTLERNKHDARGLFYAQSWVLIHYLIQGNEGKRVRQLGVFLDQLRQNIPAEKAFRQAFQTDYAGMQKELRDYVQRHSYRGQIVTFEKKLEFSAEMKTAPITDAEAHAFLGDLLFHIQRPEDAKTKLEQALALDPKLAMAHASLGMVHMQQKKFSQAKQHLQQAVAENSTNYLAHYYYAYALSSEVITEGQPVHDFPAETVRRMRAELGRAIELKPDFPESYHLLAFVNLVTGEQLDESIVMIKRAVALSPGSEEFLFVLGQLYIRKQDLEGARRVIEPLTATGADPQIRARAGSLLVRISSIQEAIARFRTGREERSGDVVVDMQTDQANNSDPTSYLRDALRKPGAGEKQSQGMLVRIDCDAKGIIFTLKSGPGLLRLKTTSFEEMDITTFAPDVAGEITCGVRKPENAVVVSYLPGGDVRAKTEGTIRSLEFVPNDFKLKP